jgi:uncharacterized delta-60 repeat protein
MRNVFTAGLVAASLLSVGPVSAFDGELDPRFITDAEYPGYGFYVSPFDQLGANDSLGGVVPTLDEKLWLVGKVRVPGSVRISVTRAERDGTVDVGFADQGLRTFVRPCEGTFTISDVVSDGAGGAFFAIAGCPDFMVYRLTAAGDLDPGFAGSGVLTVPFDKGGTHIDTAMELALTPTGGIVVAGVVATATLPQLGVANFSAAGLPVPGFGTDGKVTVPFEWAVPESGGVNGVHATADGRILAAGSISDGALNRKQFVVRLLPSGIPDPSYGNSSPGIAKVDLRVPLGLSESPISRASWMDTDGSVIQVGSLKSSFQNSGDDVFLLRWRPDGLQDTDIGAHGARQYSLDFAGLFPGNPDNNSDSARAITRQSDGRIVIASRSKSSDGFAGLGVLRLDPDFNVDQGFGNGGKVRHMLYLAQNGLHGMAPVSIIMNAGRILAAADVNTELSTTMQTLVGLQNDLLFADAFE